MEKNLDHIAEFHRAVSAVLDGSDTSDSTLQKIASIANPAYEYDKERKFKRGGEGLVLYLKHVHLRNKQFVMKVASKEIQSGKKSKSRFFRGAGYMWMLHRKLLWGVPDVVDANFDYGFYVMEYIHGVALEKFCKKASEIDNIKMFLQILDVVGVIHETGIVHRDLKPSNIYVAEHPITEILSPVVLDFGIAKRKGDKSDNLTGVGYSMGTKPWMPPEQWDDAAEADYRSDIYTLGSIFYGMMTYTKRNRFPMDLGEEYRDDEDFPTDLLSGNYLSIFMGSRGSIEQRYQTINEFKESVRLAAGFSKNDIIYLSPISGVREKVPEEEKQSVEEQIQEIELNQPSSIIIDDNYAETTGLPQIVDYATEGLVEEENDSEDIVYLKELLGNDPEADLIIAMIKFGKEVPKRNYRIGD